MLKKLKHFIEKSMYSKGLLIFLIVILSLPVGASQKIDKGLDDAVKKVAGLNLQEIDQDIDPLASSSKQDAFSWQNSKHYESVVRIFDALADREFSAIIDRIIGVIGTEQEFFDRTYGYLISKQQRRILDWMKEDVLTHTNFWNDSNPCQNNDDTSDDSDDEAPLTRMIIRAYEGGDESESSSSSSTSFSEGASSDSEVSDSEADSETDDSSSSRDESSSHSDDRGDRDCDGYNSCEEIIDKEEDEAFQDWQVRKLDSMLGISLDSMAEFTKEAIDIDAIKMFLQEHCEGGYSWLINEDVEGSLSASEDFASNVHEKLGLPEDLIANSMGALWFDYDWEEFDIADKQFLQKTYIKTLEDLKSGKRGQDVKKSLLKRVSDVFSFNKQDFQSPLKSIYKRYLKFNKRKNWLGALIEWSVYSTYRKVFANPAKKSKINGYATVHPALPVFQSFNREKYLLDRLNAAYLRANAEYTKVYPHHDTKKIVFGSPRPNRAELDLQVSLGRLKGVGMALEPFRKRGAENVFVPQLYFVVSSSPNQASLFEGEQFFQVPLCFDGLPRRPLTRAKGDKIFEGVSETDYFKKVKDDVVAGRVLQGTQQETAEQEITALIKNKGLCNPNLVHSERGVMQAFRKPANVKKICDDFASLLKTSCGAGAYTVYGAVLLGYSTNTVCPCCTPTLITLQNSHGAGGFLNLLVQNLNHLTGEITLRTAGFDPLTQQQDWTQFRLNTIVTASIDFDQEGRDLAEQGQHSFGGNTNPPQKTHNPHAKLFFPNDEIDLSQVVCLDDETPDPHQRFFYEFVGKSTHTVPAQDNPYIDAQSNLKFPGVVFSSGSDSWGGDKLP